MMVTHTVNDTDKEKGQSMQCNINVFQRQRVVATVPT